MGLGTLFYIPLCHARKGGSSYQAVLVVSFEMTICLVDLELDAWLSYPAGLPRRSSVSHCWLQLLTSPMVVGIFPAYGVW